MNQNSLETYMKYCLSLASSGASQVSPNPKVGAILVYNNKIIGEAYHKKFGEHHAEVLAIENVPEELKKYIPDATLFVNLEPCNHWGKTPPCTEFIIGHQIKKLVFGCYDPNPQMSGKSIELLKQKGLEVIGPVLEKACLEFNKEFLIHTNLLRPYTIIKFAQTADYFIGLKKQRLFISDPVTNTLVHRWRSETDAIMAGYNTIKRDNPLLTTRHWPGKNPVRIAHGNFTESEKKQLKIFNEDAPTYTSSEIINDEVFEWQIFMNQLHQKNIGTLMIEGGAKLISSAYKSGLWDEIRIIVNRNLRTRQGVPAPVIRGKLVKKQILNNDIIYYLRKYQGY